MESSDRTLLEEALPIIEHIIKLARPRVKDVFTRGIYIATGILDGGFNASDTSYCRANIINFETSI
jgi:hypothetical protein